MPTINLTLPVAGQGVTAGLHATNYAALQSLLNGGLDADNLDDMGASAGQALVYNGTSWAPASAGAGAPVTSLPGSPSDGQQALLVDSLTAPTYQWLMQYESGITPGSHKWMGIGGTFRQGESSVTLPNAGDYEIVWGVRIDGSTDDTDFLATLTASSGSLTGLTTMSILASSGTSAIGLRGGGGGPAIVTGASAAATISIVMSGGNASRLDSGVAVKPRLIS